MGTNMNFKGFGNDIQGNNNLLAHQSSIYSLTFEELQNTIGGSGKDFGSMNMDELLKSIWTAEETQILAPATVAIGGQDGGGGGGPLQRQGSLTLPRTLSQKTVDEVWKNISKEEPSGGPNLSQRQQTLGEMTLEEFLFKAGVVREDAQLGAKPSTNGGYFGDLSRFGNTGGDLGSFEFQQPNRGGVGVMGGRVAENGRVVNPGSNLPLNANGVRSNQQQQQHQQQLPQQQQQQIFPKQQTLSYSTSPLPMGTNGQLGSPRLRGGIMGMGDQGLNGALVQSAGMGMVGLGAAGAVRVATESPANQLSDGVGKSNGTDTSSVSPVPYVFNGGFRGRKGGPVEKVVERRQRRMIKNRESAARSRARKQAYTMELETEVAKLKEENQELEKKQEQMMEIQKNQDMDIVNLQRGKKRCLRRTQTGPW